MPVVTTAEYVVIAPMEPQTGTRRWPDSDIDTDRQVVHMWPDAGPRRRRSWFAYRRPATKEISLLYKVFPIKLKDGTQAAAEELVHKFAPVGPGAEPGTLSFRVYRDPAKVDYLLFVEHFADQAAYDAHTSSP